MGGSLVLRGGRSLGPAGFCAETVTIVDGRITDGEAPPGTRTIDVEGANVVPGLVDLQCNGAGGIDLRSTPEQLWDAAAALPAFGVTAWLPTIASSPPDIVARAQAALAAGPPDGFAGAVPLGLHLEGPFLAPAAAGAHPLDLLRPPDVGLVGEWVAGGAVALVTLAPELTGALDVVRTLVDAGIVVSLGHTHAAPDLVDAAVGAGASMVTHLFNAMSGLHHRDLGVAGVALSDHRLTLGLIADGSHVDRRVVAIAQRAAGERLVLVSDAVALLGEPDLDTTDGARLPDGTLAGSVLPLVEAVRNLLDWTGCPLEDAVRAASTRPAAVLGDTSRGVLEPGRRGDLVVLEPALDLRFTVVAGHVVHP